MNTPARISTPPESARMGHAHSPVTIWNHEERAQPGPWARRGHRSIEMTDFKLKPLIRRPSKGGETAESIFGPVEYSFDGEYDSDGFISEVQVDLPWGPAEVFTNIDDADSWAEDQILQRILSARDTTTGAMTDTRREEIARAVCAEKCAVYGEPPCYTIEGPWPNPNCGDCTCHDLADAVLAVTPAPEAGWRDMSSAPYKLNENGVCPRILAFVPPYGATTAHWNGECWSCHSALNREAQPTHWMPLPPAPGTQPATEQPVYETCSKCSGSGQMIGDAGEPTLCSECKGDTVVASEQPSVKEAALLKRLAAHLALNGHINDATSDAATAHNVGVDSAIAEILKVARGEAALRSLAGDE